MASAYLRHAIIVRRKHHVHLIAVAGFTFVLNRIIAALHPGVLRVVLGLPLKLSFLGYILIAALIESREYLVTIQRSA